MNEFDAWGLFVRAWGWDVAPDGAPGDTAADEFEVCGPTEPEASPPSGLCQKGKAGNGAGQFDGELKGGIAVDPASGDVYVSDRGNSRVQKFDSEGHFLMTFGGGVLDGGAAGTGALASGSDSITSVVTTSRAFARGQAITGAGVPPGTRIKAIGPGTITLTQAATTSGAGVALTAPTPAANNPANEQQSVTIGGAPTGGTFTLSFSTPDPSNSQATTTPIPFSASAAEVQAALEALANVGAGNVAVTGPAGGPWTTEFKGIRFADTNVTQMDASAAGLTPPGGKTVAVKTIAEGAGAPETCTPADVAAGGTCGAGSPGSGDGQFESKGFGNRLAVGADGTVFAGDGKGRVKTFEPNGTPKPQIPLEGLSGEAVFSLAVDGSGNFYAITNVDQTKINKFSPTGTGDTTISVGLTVESPLSLDAEGNIYTTAKSVGGSGEVVKFSPGGVPVIAPGSGFALQQGGGFIKGLATNTVTAAGDTDIYISTTSGADTSFAAAFGPPPDLWDPPEVPPAITAQFASAVDGDSATLKAQVNPLFWDDTTYFAEYGTGKCSEGVCTQQAPASPALLGAGVVSKVVTSGGVALQGLSPGTTYHYRFVAQSSGGGPVRGVGGKVGLDGAEGTFKTAPAQPTGPDTCPNAAFRGGAAAKLPDCRAYEMVSPVDKNGGDILAPIQIRSIPAELNQSAEAPGKITYSTSQGFGDSKGTPYISQYVASRDAGLGWLSHGISPPQGLIVLNVGLAAEVQFRYFSPDLCNAVLLDVTEPALDPLAPDGFANFYGTDLCGAEAYEGMNKAAPPSRKPVAFIPELQGATADGRCAAFRAPDQLTVDANPDITGSENGGTNLQLYKFCDGTLSIVSVLPNGEATKADSSLGVGNVGSIRHAGVANALSEDGRRAYWTAAGIGPGPLYVRAQVGSGAEETLPVSGLVSPGAEGRFWAASEDGSRALFSSGGDLYEFTLSDDGSSLASGVSKVAEGAIGLAGASEDLSRAYFASRDVLTTDPSPEGVVAADGEANLYFREAPAGGGEELAFVGAISEEDAQAGTFSTPSALNNSPFKHAARTSPDGRHLAFMSSASLTGYDNTDAENGKADNEVFLYSAPGGGPAELRCASCNPSGARPTGRELELEATPTGAWAASYIPGYISQLYGSRVLSDDGSRVFFTSFEALAHGDTNGRADAYQWEEEGAGSCDAAGATFDAASGGCISLVSSGQSPTDSTFIDASADGTDIFFSTATSLVPQDPGLIDIYTAHEGGGFAPPPPPPPPCVGEACQPPVAVAPPPPTASSVPGPPNEKFKKAKKKKGKKAKKGKGKGKGKKGKGKGKGKQGAGR